MTSTAHPKLPTAPPAESQTKSTFVVSVFSSMSRAEGQKIFNQMEEKRLRENE